MGQPGSRPEISLPARLEAERVRATRVVEVHRKGDFLAWNPRGSKRCSVLHRTCAFPVLGGALPEAVGGFLRRIHGWLEAWSREKIRLGLRDLLLGPAGARPRDQLGKLDGSPAGPDRCMSGCDLKRRDALRPQVLGPLRIVGDDPVPEAS